MDEIVNKVKKSNLIQLDLADFKPTEEIVLFDLKDNLWQGMALKEKDFRSFVKEHDWGSYKNKVVGVICSVDAIIPTWAFMLVVTKLQENGVLAFIGDKNAVELELIKRNITAFDLEKFKDGKFIIKGCSNIPEPSYVMTELTKKLMPIASSIMYGEPCSTVPVYKRRKL